MQAGYKGEAPVSGTTLPLLHCPNSGASPDDVNSYFGAVLCLTKVVTISFCANAMALFAVVMWAPESTLGNCIAR